MSKRYFTLEALMKKFCPETFMSLLSNLGELNSLPKDSEVTFERAHTFVKLLPSIRDECARLELTVSVIAIDDALDNEALAPTQSQLLLSSLFSVRQTVQMEMKSKVFLLLEGGRVPLAFEPHQFGQDVDLAFPSASWDIEEAARCLAFDRSTAAVFHLSRVAEIAAVTIGKRVGYKSPKQGFGEVLNYMDNGLRQVDKKYTEEEAARIWEATKGLMQHLATKLKEDEEA